MKKLFSIFFRVALLIILLFAGSNILQAQHLKKDGTPDMRYKENKSASHSSYSSPSSSSTIHLKKDGTPDMRYKENKASVAPATEKPNSSSQGNSGVRTGCICNDGTRSSATGSGACSHHGGVKNWIY